MVKCVVVSIFEHWMFVCVDELMCKHTSLHGVADDRVNS